MTHVLHSTKTLWELAPGEGPTIVTFPPAGAGASFFKGVLEPHLPGFRILGVQYPGRQNRLAEAPLRDRAELVEEAVQALRKLARERAGATLILLGHSLGALIAFETALALAAEPGMNIDALVMCACDERTGGGRPNSPDPLNADDATLLAWLAGLGAMPSVVMEEPELAQIVARQLRGDLAAARNTPLQGTLSIPLVLVCGDADPVASEGGMLGWRDRTSASSRFVSIPGGHDAVREAAGQWISAANLESVRA